MMSHHSADFATDATISTATLTIPLWLQYVEVALQPAIMLLTLILLAARLWYLISTIRERRAERRALRDDIEP